jgi:hypothetical protein
MPKATRAVQEAARRIVRARDEHRCQMCGRSIVDVESSIHHRINRGRGGSALLERPSLLIRLCGSGTTLCHGWVTEHPKLSGETGWLLPRNNPDIDPTQEPILLFDGWHLLSDDGGRTPCASPLPYVGEAV